MKILEELLYFGFYCINKLYTPFPCYFPCSAWDSCQNLSQTVVYAKYWRAADQSSGEPRTKGLSYRRPNQWRTVDQRIVVPRTKAVANRGPKDCRTADQSIVVPRNKVLANRGPKDCRTVLRTKVLACRAPKQLRDRDRGFWK